MSPRAQRWLEWVLATSVPLRRLDESGVPIAVASGCFVDYGGKRFLLSVQHAVDKGSRNWIVELAYDQATGTDFFKPRGFNYVAEMTRGSGEIRHIDFCYTEVPDDLVSIFQHITPRGIQVQRPRHVFRPDLSTVPDRGQIFGFSGQVKLEMHGTSALVTEMHVFPGLRYLRTDGEYHVFQLPVSHPGHQQFKGCSGAPIVDMKKRIVALVCDGDTSKNTIRGVSLARYKFAFDFVCGGLGAA